MKKIIPLFLFSILIFQKTKAQEINYCGTTEAAEIFFREHPEKAQKIIQARQALEENTRKYTSDQNSRLGFRGAVDSTTVYIIPVVFHIIHNNGPENISDAQIFDAIRILNEDFRKLNKDTTAILKPFQKIAGDAKIEFRLAQKDPQGNCTNGIDRILSLKTFNGNNSNKPNVWPRDKYMNIWVVSNITSPPNALGYTMLPYVVDDSPEIDGILIRSIGVGSIGTGLSVNSRALTHEVGHWFNLWHNWGQGNFPVNQGNCAFSDSVDDTPPTIGWTSCNLNLKSGTCQSNKLDNVQNYMEYSYCSNMFTKGQVKRMRACLTDTIADRNKIWQYSNLVATGTDGSASATLCNADFTANKTIICVGNKIVFKDSSYFGAKTWSWKFSGGIPSTSSAKSPAITYSTAGNYDVELTVSDGNNSKIVTKKSFITVLPATGRTFPFTEDFETIKSLPDINWMSSTGIDSWAITTDAAVSGIKSIKSTNSTTSDIGKTDELISTTIDMSTIADYKKVCLSFMYAFARHPGKDSSDVLNVCISNDCGQNNWPQRWTSATSLKSNFPTAPAQTQPFIPTALEWKHVNVPNFMIPTYLTKNFRLKFQFKNGGGNNIYIDDIILKIDNCFPDAIEENTPSTLNFNIYPNPMGENTIVAFNITKRAENVYLSIFDFLGREFSVFYNKSINAGEYQYKLTKENMNLAKGIYIVKLMVDNEIFTKKIVVD